MTNTNTPLLASLTDVQALTDQARIAMHVGDFSDLMVTGHLLRVARQHIIEATDQWAALAIEAGASWAQIGDAIGITRQAAQQRYAHLT
jgi:hypothetical protein